MAQNRSRSCVENDYLLCYYGCLWDMHITPVDVSARIGELLHFVKTARSQEEAALCGC